MQELLPYKYQSISIRRLELHDLHAFHSYRSCDKTARFQGWSPMSLSEAEAFIKAQMEQTKLNPGEWQQFAVASAENNLLIGDIGLWLSPEQIQMEFGLTISPKCQGKGCGTQVVRALVKLLFEQTTVNEIIANTDSRNQPCLAMLLNSGMRYQSSQSAEYKGEICEEKLFSINRNAL